MVDNVLAAHMSRHEPALAARHEPAPAHMSRHVRVNLDMYGRGHRRQCSRATRKAGRGWGGPANAPTSPKPPRRGAAKQPAAWHRGKCWMHAQHHSTHPHFPPLLTHSYHPAMTNPANPPAIHSSSHLLSYAFPLLSYTFRLLLYTFPLLSYA